MIATAFHTSFYVVVATILPVLFLGLTLQDSGWIQASVWVAEKVRGLRLRAISAKGARQRNLLSLEIAGLRMVESAFTLVELYAVLGELCALSALDRQRATSFEHQSAWNAAVLLTIAGGASLLVRFQVAMAQARRQQREQAAAEAEVLEVGD